MKGASEGDGARINIERDEEVAYWSEKLRVPPDHLRAAVRDVGPAVRDVVKHIDPRNRQAPVDRQAPVPKRVTDSFERGLDGRWRCIEPVILHHSDQEIPIERGAEFGPGDTLRGLKVAEFLDSLVETRRAAH